LKLNSGRYFGQTLRERRGGELRLTLSTYPPGQAQPWHVHAQPTLFLLLAGQNEDRARHGEHPQPPLTFVFHPTTEPHAAQVGPSGMRGLNIEWNERWLAQHELSERDLGGYRPLDSVSSRLGALRFLATAFQEGPPACGDHDTLLLELLEPLVPALAPPEVTLAPRWLRQVETLLHDQYRLPLSLGDVAQAVAVHPVHVARVFRRRHGCSVGEYLRALRLAEAGRLILAEGWTVAAAAYETGFADHAHLTRGFSHQFGFAPRALRKARTTLSP
jgi:AraC family transcriptional regulator